MAPSDIITIRYAETDADVVLIHRFLCVVAGPTLPGSINPQKSATEVWRVVNDEVALMAMTPDGMVGTLGLVCPDHWWGDVHFFANRWMYAIPGSQAWKPLIKEAKAIAVASGLELHIITEGRGKLLILNKDRRRHGIRPNQDDRLVHTELHPSRMAH